MSMMVPFDTRFLNDTIISVVNDTFKEMCHVDFTAEPVVTEREIIEYDGRMRLTPMEKFNGPAYAGVINYYISQKDQNAGLAVGTFVLYVKEEFAEKIVKAFGHTRVDMDNEDILKENINQFCKILAEKVKNALVSNGYSDLLSSPPLVYKNVVPEGAKFDYNLFKKQELIFSFWNKQCIVAEACMGSVPRRSK
jgi:hypothetical protein